MRAPEFLGALLLIMPVAGGLACGSGTAPPSFLVPAQDEFTDTYGGWIEVRLKQLDPREIRGELIAVEPDTLFVQWLREGRPRLAAIPRSGIEFLRLQGYDPAAGGHRAWTILGALSTASHGAGLVFTLPMWLVGGLLATHAQAHAADLEFPEGQWGALGRYARFPQGLPPGLDRSGLRPHPFLGG